MSKNKLRRLPQKIEKELRYEKAARRMIELARVAGVPKMKCKAESEDICRALYCPRHSRRLMYCPWEKN